MAAYFPRFTGTKFATLTSKLSGKLEALVSGECVTRAVLIQILAAIFVLTACKKQSIEGIETSPSDNERHTIRKAECDENTSDCSKNKPKAQNGNMVPNPQPGPDKQITQKTTEKLFIYYTKQENYNAVKQTVGTFYKPVTTNGCIAFMSTALRKIGINIPFSTLDGEPVSLVTRPFSKYLKSKLGWKEIRDPQLLVRGDIVFSEDAAGYPGYPAHVYMFAGWTKQKGYGLVVDNQGFTHQRNISARGESSPFQYALRPNE